MKISIIIPVYNSTLYLKQCVESILAQTYHNFEILLVDDGSTDDRYVMNMPKKMIELLRFTNRTVEHQMQETSDWRKPVVITSHLWTMMIIGVIQMRCVIS
jgi:hypothetical protein